MGNFLGSKRSSSKESTRHGNCRCTLYDKHKHCCRQSCFGADREKREKALLSVLAKYKAEYLISTIMEYLQYIYNLVEISTDISAPDYLSYSYEPLKSLIGNTSAPCDAWMKSLKTAPVAAIKVCKSISDIHILYIPFL